MLAPIGVVAGLTAIALAADISDEDPGSATATTPTSGPETISDNEAHPPQADLNGDLECILDELGWVEARGTLTNNSSETSSYMIQVSFNDGAGVRFAEAPVFHNDVRAGETVRWDAPSFQRPADGTWTCEVVSIERFSSQ